MEQIARNHVLFGLAMAMIGMVLGIVMASSHDHGQHVTHAHLLLLGLVVSLLYAMVYRLWVGDVAAGALGWAQLILHQGGTVAMVIGLYMLYGQVLPAATIEPLLGVSSVAVLAAMVLMMVVFVRATRQSRSPSTRAPVQGLRT